MKTTSFNALALAVALGVSTPATAATPATARSLVPADAQIVLLGRDPAKLRESWRKTPLARLFEDASMRRFLAPMREQLGVEKWDEEVLEATGLKLDELLALFEGEVALYVSNLEAVAASDGETTPTLVVVAGLGDDPDALVALIERLEEKQSGEEPDDPDLEVVRIRREVQGVEVHEEKQIRDGETVSDESWAVAGKTFILASPDSLMDELIVAAQRGGLQRPLAESEAFKSVAAIDGTEDFLVFVNVGALFPAMEIGLAKAAEEAQSEGTPDPRVIVGALGLDAVKAFAFSTKLAEDAVAVDAAVTFSERRGLFRVFAYGADPAPRPAFIPANAVGFSAASFDPREAWAGVADMVNRLDPNILPTVAASLKQRSGLEPAVLGRLLDSLGTELVSVEMRASGAQPEQTGGIVPNQMALVVSLADRQTLEASLESVKTAVAGGGELFTSRDYLGSTIYTLALPPPAEGAPKNPFDGFCYTVTDRLLVVGFPGPEALEAVLVQESRGGSSVWQEPTVKAAIDRLPTGAVALQHVDVASASGPFLAGFTAACAASASATGGGCDPSAVPSPDVIASYLGAVVVGVYRDGPNLTFRARLLPPATARP